MNDWRYGANASLAYMLRDTEPDLEPDQIEDAFGITVEQPTHRERRAHRDDRLANRDARASDVAGRLTHPEGTPNE